MNDERPQRIDCPRCGGTCMLDVDSKTASYATLPDRMVALGPMACGAVCQNCGHRREGVIHDLDVELATGRLAFGRIVLEDE